MPIKYDANSMKYMQLFETITRTTPKSCFIDDLSQLVFIVKEGEIGKAIGRKGANIKRLEQILKKRVKLVEYSSDLIQFIKNLIYPIKSKKIEESDGIVTITSDDLKSRGFLIGRGASNLRNYESIIQKYFPIQELKVV